MDVRRVLNNVEKKNQFHKTLFAQVRLNKHLKKK